MLCRFLIIIAAIVALAHPSWNQTNFGLISGTVLDGSGAAVPDCRVTVTNSATGSQQNGNMGWRISSTASAWATMPDGTKRLKITLTGSGTFSPWEPNDVTGGGHYEIADQSGKVIDSGDFVVLGLVSYKQSPGGGAVPSGTDVPLLPNAVEIRGGLSLFHVQYSDGTLGSLTVSCNQSGGASGQT